MNFSLRPSPYTSAVSKKVTPAERAASRTALAAASSTSPQSAPNCQVPRPITLRSRFKREGLRCSIIKAYPAKFEWHLEVASESITLVQFGKVAYPDQTIAPRKGKRPGAAT